MYPTFWSPIHNRCSSCELRENHGWRFLCKVELGWKRNLPFSKWDSKAPLQKVSEKSPSKISNWNPITIWKFEGLMSDRPILRRRLFRSKYYFHNSLLSTTNAFVAIRTLQSLVQSFQNRSISETSLWIFIEVCECQGINLTVLTRLKKVFEKSIEIGPFDTKTLSNFEKTDMERRSFQIEKALAKSFSNRNFSIDFCRMARIPNHSHL